MLRARRPSKLMLFAHLAALLVLVTACDYSNSKAPREISFSNEAGKNGISFATVSQGVFQPKCVSCHANYASYESVRREISAIQSAIEFDRMPKRGPPLNDVEKQLIAQWIELGAPGDDASPPAPAPPLEPRWESISVNVVFPKCLVCHNPQGQAKFLDLSTRQAFFQARDREFGGVKLLDFENPSESYVVAIVEDPIEPMPPPSSRIPKLTEEELLVLKKWIELGIP